MAGHYMFGNVYNLLLKGKGILCSFIILCQKVTRLICAYKIIFVESHVLSGCFNPKVFSKNVFKVTFEAN
ncbi:hypothetical protein AQUCO_03100059v1 [Aquilegia coerulea]|uniref:Uncharacterized protein n=1 Tax=Aquilegia coerulea TaxID=218851 RepID=A0A2G5D0L5_AQUCA|nr:hypothetical protein AQUCO_03100059v1 [Aquilegia coerulea]